MTHSKSNLAAKISHKLRMIVNDYAISVPRNCLPIPATICSYRWHGLNFSLSYLPCMAMFYNDSVQNTRQIFFSSWQKYRQKQPLLPLEQQIVDVVIGHPEYQLALERGNAENAQAYFPEMGQTNPFLHMGLHLAIRDQIATDRPPGITKLYQQLLAKYNDEFIIEHLLMEHLAECLWQAQKNQSMPDETSYLNACMTLL